jgi:hypothetical protein
MVSGLHTQAALRHRRLVLAGFAVTLVLAVLSYVRISPSGIGYRSSEVWSDRTSLVLSQPGTPEYLSSFRKGDRRRTLFDLAGLAEAYAASVTSDEVVTALKKRGLINALDINNGGLPITATTLPSSVTRTTPVIEITGKGASPTEATALTRVAANAFIAMVVRRQSASEIPEDERIKLLTVRQPGVPKLVMPRSKTPLILVLFAGLTTTVAALAIRGRSDTSFAPTEARW